jgi:hypothetical protein
MRYFIFTLLLLCFMGCHYKSKPAVQQAKVDTPSDIYFPGLPWSEVDSPEVPEPPKVVYPFTFIKEFPVIKDTIAFIKELRKSCVLEVDDMNGSFKEDITYYRRLQINGSNERFILLEYDYHDGCGAAFPWKYQLIFKNDGTLVKSIDGERFELVTIFPNQPPFLLIVTATSKGNGGHQIYKISGDTLENIYDGYKDYETQTYDAHQDNTIFEPYELKLKIKDYNQDGWNDIAFYGKMVLIRGVDKTGAIWFDGEREISEKHPFIKIPVEYIFLYNRRTGHFEGKEPYSIDRTIETQLKDTSSNLYHLVNK